MYPILIHDVWWKTGSTVKQFFLSVINSMYVLPEGPWCTLGYQEVKKKKKKLLLLPNPLIVEFVDSANSSSWGISAQDKKPWEMILQSFWEELFADCVFYLPTSMDSRTPS